MQRNLTPEEQEAIKNKVLDQLAKDTESKPDITEEQLQPIYEKMLSDATRLAASLPPKATGGPVSRLLQGYWRGLPGAVSDAIGGGIQMLADAPANLQRETEAAIESSKKGDFFGLMGHAIGAVPVVGPLAKGYVAGAEEGFEKSGEAFRQNGQEVPGVIHAALAPVPFVGPMLASQYDRGRSGDIAGQIGEMGAMVTPELLPDALKLIPKSLIRNKNAANAALVDRMIQQGYPMDLATASGMPMVKVVQRVGSEGLVGSVPTAIMNARDEAIYKGKAEQLATDASQVPHGPLPQGATGEVTPIQAGTQVVDRLRGTQNTEFKAGSEHYLDADMKVGMADPEFVKKVQDFNQGQQARAEHSLGRKLKPEEVPELRRILVEMEEQPYTENIWSPTEGKDRGNTPSGQWNVTGGGAGAHVYDLIKEKMPLTEYTDPKTGQTFSVNPKPERADVIASLKKALLTGHFTGPAKAAMEVVAERIANPQGAAARSAAFGPGAGDIMREVAVPVDPTPAQDALRNVYEHTLEMNKLKNKSAEPAMDRLIGFMNNKDAIGIMDLEEVLSEFKKIARGNKEVRDPGARPTPDQALAYQAIAAIEPIIQEKGAKIPGLMESLEKGRGHWKEGFKVKQVADEIDDISVSAAARFNKLSGPLGTELLQRVQKIQPDAIPDIAKGKLDQINQLAFSGKSTGPGQAFNEFKTIEPESLKILFPEPGHAEQLRDLYQTMAMRAENVNPSGSMLGAAKVGEVGTVLQLLTAKLGEGAGLTAARGTAYAPYAALTSLMFGALGIAGHSSTVTRILLEGKGIPLKNAAAVMKWSQRLKAAMDAADQQTNGPVGGGSTAPFGQQDIELPAEGARDPRLPPQ